MFKTKTNTMMRC